MVLQLYLILDFFGTHREGIKVTAGPFAKGNEASSRLF